MIPLVPLVTLLLTTLVPPAVLAGQQVPEVRIGVLLDGPTDRTDPLEDQLQEEIRSLLGSEFRVRFPEGARTVGDWTPAGVRAGLEALLADPTVDVILALGVVASAEAAVRGELPTPVVAPYVSPGARGLPRSGDRSGVPNLNYLTLPQVLESDLRILREVAPVASVAFLVSAPYVEYLTRLGPDLRAAGATLGIDVEAVPVGFSSQEVLDRLSPGVEAVYLTPLMTLSAAEFEALVRGLLGRRLPTMSLLGVEEVEAGVFLTLTPPDDFRRLARRVALHVQRILLGDPAETLPVGYARGERLTVNMATARAIGVFPPFSVLAEADQLNRRRSEPARTLSLASVVEEALQANLDLAAEERAVAAGAEDVREARASLLPRLEASVQGLLIDQDRAEASFGAQPQRTFTAGGTVTQLLYAEPAWANLGIQANLQEGRGQRRDAVRLDVVEAAAAAYLDVLRAKTLERVRRDDLRTTRSHLELARLREEVGASGPGEVYRWRSALATSRRALLDAQAARQQAETELNRILRRPLEENFATVEPELDDPSLITSDPRLEEYTRDPFRFVVFRDFMEAEARGGSPELRELDAAVRAAERAHASTRRAFWTPTVALQGQLLGRVGEGGAGTSAGLNLPPGTPSLVFPEADDLDWSLALRFSHPLFTSGQRRADRARAREELRELRLRREAVAQRVDQRMRVALLAAGASFPGIELAREAADAAGRNLELVRDGYAQGLVSVLDLLDAQNAALQADEAAVSAVYGFLLDLMAVERALGRFTFLSSPEEREAFWERARRFFEEAPPPEPSR